MNGDQESMLPGWLQDGASMKVIRCVYVSVLILIVFGAYLSYYKPFLGLPFLFLAVGFLVTWYLFEHEYRDFNLQLKATAPVQGDSRGDSQGGVEK